MTLCQVKPGHSTQVKSGRLRSSPVKSRQLKLKSNLWELSRLIQLLTRLPKERGRLHSRRYTKNLNGGEALQELRRRGEELQTLAHGRMRSDRDEGVAGEKRRELRLQLGRWQLGGWQLRWELELRWGLGLELEVGRHLSWWLRGGLREHRETRRGEVHELALVLHLRGESKQGEGGSD